jgi:hypothetical protein
MNDPEQKEMEKYLPIWVIKLTRLLEGRGENGRDKA